MALTLSYACCLNEVGTVKYLLKPNQGFKRYRPDTNSVHVTFDLESWQTESFSLHIIYKGGGGGGGGGAYV